MKKVLFFAAILGGVLAGCSKNEVPETNASSSPILFNAPVVGTMTKAPVSGTTFPTSVDFKVWALFAKGNANTLTGLSGRTNTNEYFKGLPFTYFNNEGVLPTKDSYWRNSTAVWPKQEGRLNFHAFSPASVSPTHTWDEIASSTGKTGFTLDGYSVLDGGNVKGEDLMYSEYALNKVKADNDDSTNSDDDSGIHKYEGVDMVFHHALSIIRFQIALKTSNPLTEYNLTSISLVGDNTTGDFKENVNFDDATPTAEPEWSNWSSPRGGSPLTLYNSGEITTTPRLLYNESSPYEGQFIVLPQTLTDDVKIKVVYTENINSLGAVTIEPAAVKLKGLTASSGTYDDKWKPGYRYTYKIIIDLDEIKIDPAVTEWNEVVVEGPTVTE